MCIVFIGVGPSCVALLCHWIRHHHEWFSQQKIILVEKNKQLGIPRPFNRRRDAMFVHVRRVLL